MTSIVPPLDETSVALFTDLYELTMLQAYFDAGHNGEATVLAACEAGFEVHVIEDATRAITAEGGAAARDRMREAGARFDMTE